MLWAGSRGDNRSRADLDGLFTGLYALHKQLLELSRAFNDGQLEKELDDKIAQLNIPDLVKAFFFILQNYTAIKSEVKAYSIYFWANNSA